MNDDAPRAPVSSYSARRNDDGRRRRRRRWMASPMCAPRPVPSRRPATSTNATTRRERRRSTRTRVWLKCSFATRRETPRATRATCPAKRRLARVAIASSRSTRRGTVRAVSNTCPASGFRARTGRRARRVSDCTRRTNDDGENERNCATNVSRAGNRDLGEFWRRGARDFGPGRNRCVEISALGSEGRSPSSYRALQVLLVRREWATEFELTRVRAYGTFSSTSP